MNNSNSILIPVFGNQPNARENVSSSNLVPEDVIHSQLEVVRDGEDPRVVVHLDDALVAGQLGTLG